jgi:hypothetical protein
MRKMRRAGTSSASNVSQFRRANVVLSGARINPATASRDEDHPDGLRGGGRPPAFAPDELRHQEQQPRDSEQVEDRAPRPVHFRQQAPALAPCGGVGGVRRRHAEVRRSQADQTASSAFHVTDLAPLGLDDFLA